MFRPLTAALALTLVALTGATAPADDKKDKADPKAPSGTWVREANGLDLKMEFDPKGTLKASVFAGENGVIATCKYTVDKNGVVRAEVTGVEEKGNFPSKPPKGLEFSFKWTVKGDTATLADLKGEGLDEARQTIEGDYERKKEKK